MQTLAEKNGDSGLVLNNRVQLQGISTTNEEKTRLEELALIETNSGEICMGHLLGYSKKRADEKRPEEQKYCPGCKHDFNNRLCHYYKPLKLLYIEPILKQEPSSSF